MGLKSLAEHTLSIRLGHPVQVKIHWTSIPLEKLYRSLIFRGNWKSGTHITPDYKIEIG